MERLSRLVVQVESALEFRSTGDVDHLRLSLLLLDSAAELLMHRAVDPRLEEQEWVQRQIESFTRWEATGPSSEYLVSLRARALSKRRVQKIAREFDAKADYLVELRLIDQTTCRVLRKLHQYRNETYHRDQVRLESLQSAVTIYARVVLYLMERLPPGWMHLPAQTPPVVSRFLGDQPMYAARFDSQVVIAGLRLSA